MTEQGTAGHTPGPWEVMNDGLMVGTPFVGDRIIVQTGEQSRSADARLIAQAPALRTQRDALLAACKLMVEALDSLRANDELGHDADVDALEEGQAAIALCPEGGAE